MQPMIRQMKTDNKYHVFFQDGHDKPRTFKYGNREAKFTEDEVDLIVSLLPKDHKAIRIIWCLPEEYLEYKRKRETVNNIQEENNENLNLNENGSNT